MGHPRGLECDLFDLVGGFQSTLNRSRVRQLDVRDQVALVLHGNEARGDAGKSEPCKADKTDVDEQHDGAETEAPADSVAVKVSGPVEEPVETVEESSQQLVYRSDQEPPQRTAGDRPREEEDGVRPER